MTHQITIKIGSKAHQFLPTCSCGWKGFSEGTKAKATKSGNEHKRGH